MKISAQLKGLKFRDIYPALVCIILFILALDIRSRILYEYCFQVTDSDQLLLWDVANDMHLGIFHEPCFYGQLYNPLVEPLFALPLIWFRTPLYIALPLVSWILGFFPYILLGWACFKQKRYISAAFAFAYLLWLPLQFHVIDSIPRGYGPACAFASVGIYAALFTITKNRFFWFGFLSLLSFTISQNCVFFIAPVAVFLWLENYKNFKFYVGAFIGILAALPLPIFIYWFYSIHPNYVIHVLEYTFDFDTFKASLRHIDTILNFLSPGAGNKLVIVGLGYATFMILCLIKKNIQALAAIIAGLAVFTFTLWFDKARDGTDSFFFSSVRMYLGIPLSFIVFAYWAEVSFKIKSYRNLMPVAILSIFLIAGLIFSYERNKSFNQELFNTPRGDDVVAAMSVKSYKENCDQVDTLCKAYHTDLVILDDWRVGIDYMSPALNYPFQILRPCYERRTWDMQAEDHITRKNFIYLPNQPDSVYINLPANVDIRPTSVPTAFLVTTHGRKVFDILKDLGVEIGTY